MKYKFFLSFVCLLGLMLLGCCKSSSKDNLYPNEVKQINTKLVNPPSLTIAGTYEFGDSKGTGPRGSIIIYPKTANSALFFLDICKGAPSYNLGQLFGEIVFKDGIGIYDSRKYSKHLNCYLKFEFKETTVLITTHENCLGCGFGNGVQADNLYKRTSSNKPKFFINGSGDTILFSGMTVHKYLSGHY